MAEVGEVCKFDVPVDAMSFSTQTNGDAIRIKGINLDKYQAACLAWLINQRIPLKVKIKAKNGDDD